MKQIPSMEFISRSAVWNNAEDTNMFASYAVLTGKWKTTFRMVAVTMFNVTEDKLLVLLHPENEGITMFRNVAYIYHWKWRTISEDLSVLNLLFSDAVNCIASVTNEWLPMERWWNDTKWERMKYWETSNFPVSPFSTENPTLNLSGLKRHRGYRLVNNRLSHGTTYRWLE
jgi:hypothetical protein